MQRFEVDGVVVERSPERILCSINGHTVMTKHRAGDWITDDRAPLVAVFRVANVLANLREKERGYA
ncbi:MAG: hypothetical protein AAGB19_02475 [Cyanobacteria bacterium P01_F01_bin.3]